MSEDATIHVLPEMVFDPDTVFAHVWKPEELADVFEHQMKASVAFDLSELDKNIGQALDVASPPIATFEDMFRHPKPPLRVLQVAKRFMKETWTQHRSLLPQEVATVFYFLCLVLAQQHWGEKITELSDEKVRKGVEWSSSRPWIDESSRATLKAGVNLFS